MRSEREDLLEFSDYAWNRLRERVDGMTDDEYFWEPGVTTMVWRITHVRDMLAEERNFTWLGVPVPADRPTGSPTSAADALAELAEAYALWRKALADTGDLSAPIGRIAGPFGDSTRRAFVHHILDELIHHGAEIALLRDLYEAGQ
ncbi:DinB family protein [Labedaea rhizosphaerae]|uniref:DinB family protein n=1 Tax=Labedaea rhizosphaerae TaxID=598644 RepID=A0A4R6SF96_LABRH|nr:DinB family protein [Labedaea rhizosphaerae]TDQ00147.1 DinB family protein [Labedaea rhizosphaerae]